MRLSPPSSARRYVKRGSFCWAKLWATDGSPPRLREEEWKMTAAGLGRGARGREWKWCLVSPGRVHQGPGSALSWHRLARPWLRYPIPGARSHMPGNPTLLGPSPQLPAAMSKQDFWRRKRVSRAEQQGSYFREGGSPGEGSPHNRGERLRGERGQGRKGWGRGDKAGAGRGVDAPGKGVDGH